MKNKRGFTLIELMVSVIVIGILVAVAVPGYLDMQERTRASEALATMDNIRTALAIYHDRESNQAYTANIASLQAINPFPANDGSWTYSVTILNDGEGEPRFYEITATRLTGAHVGDTIVMDQTGEITVPAAGDNAWPP